MFKLKSICAMLALIFLFACSNTEIEMDSNSETNSDSTEITNNTSEENSINEDLLAKFELLMINLPLPVKILDELKETSASFNADELTHIGNSSGFTSLLDKTINLGFYGTDLVYASKYEKTSDVLSYLNSVKSLSEDIGVPIAINANILERYESNQNNVDSIVDLTFEIYDNIVNLLKDNGDIENAAVVNTSSRIEGLYLSCQNFPKEDQNENIDKLRTRIGQEGLVLKEAVALLSYFEDEDIKKYVNELSKIETYYSNIADPSTITNDEIEELTNILTEIRNLYILKN